MLKIGTYAYLEAAELLLRLLPLNEATLHLEDCDCDCTRCSSTSTCRPVSSESRVYRAFTVEAAHWCRLK